MSDGKFEFLPPTDEELIKSLIEQRDVLHKRVDELSMSNIKLIAELGEIARLLGAKPDMRSVLDEIEKLQQAAAPTRDAVDL